MEYKVIQDNDSTRWYRADTINLHRDDGPAIEWNDGGYEYWVNGRRHRVGGPAVVWCDGKKVWYVHGKVHRLDGPAIEWANGAKDWFVYGKRHRVDGPAIEFADGTKEWWLDGKKQPPQYDVPGTMRNTFKTMVRILVSPFKK